MNENVRKNKIKIGLVGLLLLTLILFLPACWDKKEVDQLGIVSAIGVEPAKEGRLRVIVQEINTSTQGGAGGGGGGGGKKGGDSKPYVNYSGEGTTLFNAFREISLQSPHRLFYAHSQVIIISETLARERGIKEIMDIFERNPEIRLTNYLLVGRGDMTALFNVPQQLEATPGQSIDDIIENRNQTSQYAVLKLKDFLGLMESESSQPYTAMVEVVPNKALPEKQQDKAASAQKPKQNENIQVSNTAVFRRDKMVGWLTPKESRGLLWLKGKVHGGTIVIPAPEGKSEPVTLEIIRSKTQMRPEIRNGKIVVTVAIDLDSNLQETMTYLDLTRPAIIDELEKQEAAVVKNEVKSALSKAQKELAVDVFGFGQEVMRKDPQKWKKLKTDWSELYPNVQVQLQVKAKINNTGLVNKPVQPRQ